MNLPHFQIQVRRKAAAAFTMVEVALSIAIVAFALVAIIGVMPTGLTVQKDNREEAIINQDAQFWLEAIRGGPSSTNLSVLSANLISITAYQGGVPFTPTAPPGILSAFSAPQQGGSNSCTATFRAFSGALRDRDTNAQLSAFSYVVTSEINPVESYATNAAYLRYLTNNLWDVRLTFRWPVLNVTNTGVGRLTVRAQIGGQLSQDTNSLWLFRPAFYGP